MPKEIRCRRCGRLSPSASTIYLRNNPLGITCYNTVKKRNELRALGPNKRIVLEPDTGLFHFSSDVSAKYCPDEEVFCLSCPNILDKECPLEKAIAAMRNSGKDI
jgi:hypothetical protein